MYIYIRILYLKPSMNIVKFTISILLNNVLKRLQSGEWFG